MIRDKPLLTTQVVHLLGVYFFVGMPPPADFRETLYSEMITQLHRAARWPVRRHQRMALVATHVLTRLWGVEYAWPTPQKLGHRRKLIVAIAWGTGRFHLRSMAAIFILLERGHQVDPW